MQTKRSSLIESITGTAIGFVVSLISIFIILPVFGIESTPMKNVGITIYFTVISILRSYVVRRWFNSKQTTTTD